MQPHKHSKLLVSFHPVEFSGILDLAPGVLASHGEIHGMASASVGSGISQALDILLDLATQVVFKFHRVEVRCEVEDLGLVQFANFHRVMQVEAGHDPLARVGSDSEEGFERTLRKSCVRETFTTSVKEP